MCEEPGTAGLALSGSAQLDWVVLTIWRREDDDSPEVQYEQHLVMLSPSGRELLDATTTFQLERCCYQYHLPGASLLTRC